MNKEHYNNKKSARYRSKFLRPKFWNFNFQFSIFALCFCLSLGALFPLAFRSSALDLAPVNAQGGYRWFSAPLNVAFSENSAFVADANYGVFRFDENRALQEILTVPDADGYGDIAFANNVLAGLADGKLYVKHLPDDGSWTVDDTADSLLNNSYAALAAAPSGLLFALKQDGKIDMISVTPATAASVITIASSGTVNPASVPCPVSICAYNGGVLIADNGKGGGNGSIAFYSAAGEAGARPILDLPPIRHIVGAGGASDNTVIAAHENGDLVKYDLTTGAILARTGRADGHISAPARVSVYGGAAYVSDSDTLAVNRYGLNDLNFQEAYFYSRGSDAGRLNGPGGLAVWGGGMIVADTGNRRVQVWNNARVQVIGNSGADPFIAPYDAAADAEGNIYVADNRTGLYKFNRDETGYTQTYKTVLNGGRASVTAIAATPDGKLFAADRLNNRVYLTRETQSGDAQTKTYCGLPAAPASLAASHLLPAVFCLTEDGKVYLLCGEAAVPVTKGENDPISLPNAKHIAVDAADNLFLYTENDPDLNAPAIVKYSPLISPADILSGARALDAYAAYAEGARRPVSYPDGLNAKIAGMACDANTGELYLSDLNRSVVSGFNGLYGETQAAADPYPHPVDYAAPAAVTKIETARVGRGASAFAVPYGSRPEAALKQDAPVIVLERDLPGNDYFSYVFLPETGKAGYVLKAVLGAPAAAVKPSFETGRIFIEMADIYKYPSKSAPVLTRLPKDKAVKLLAAPIFESGTDRWYCIEMENGTVGFIDVLNLSNYKYRPTDGTLATDAAIARSGGAALYERNEAGEYVPLDVPYLPDGTRVKVAGVFDPNSDYTPVTYRHPEFGLIDGYVRTKYVKYDSISRFQLLMLGALAVLLAAAVLAFVVVRKKRGGRPPVV
ncbi:MAG: hypothetical protein LBL66_08865 [Clostridiales bacterium]|jgi:hypothetical protein|nr:hypothetical protein [Clostridiales bacterium]